MIGKIVFIACAILFCVTLFGFVITILEMLNVKKRVKYWIKRWKKKRAGTPKSEEVELPACIEKIIDDYLEQHH
ncbi:MAG: hypothetical protein ACLRMP_10595 [Blautia sp.]